MWAIKDAGMDVVQLPTDIQDGNDLVNSLVAAYKDLVDADFLVLCSPTSGKVFDDVLQMVAMVNKKRGYHDALKVLVDYDDDLFNIPPTNQAYALYGTQEVKLADGRDLWKDGKEYKFGKFSVQENLHRLNNIQNIMRKTDAILTTTDSMVNNFKRYNTNVYANPNCIDMNMFNIDIPEDPRETDEIRILYAGGNSHFLDFNSIKPAIAKILKNYPNVNFTFMGQAYHPGEDIDVSRIHTIPFTGDYNEYVVNLKMLNPDIGICPLEHTRFNSCKSPIKWVEYSGIGCASVVAQTVYGDHARNNETAVVYDNTLNSLAADNFYEKVAYLLDNPDERKRIAMEAYTHISKVYSLEKQAERFIGIMDHIKDPSSIYVPEPPQIYKGMEYNAKLYKEF
jgi:glycosyltransferase involved in cell wall biosynthesis